MATDQRHHHVGPAVIKTLLLSGVLIYSYSAPLAVSQAVVASAITPDGTLGTTVAPPVENVYNINGGTIKGNNQFHSFDRFNVGTGDIASFNGPNGIANILSRVTGLQSGLQQSMIDGTLRSTITGANLFLLNPAGVLFGPNASLDVSGSFHVSTADLLRFGDGNTFYTNPALDGLGDSVLRVAPPEAFGFLGNPTTFGFTSETPAPITIEGSFLQVPTPGAFPAVGGQTLSVVGGAITITGGTPEGGAFRGATLSAPSGRIHIASLASPGEVTIESPEGVPVFTVDPSAALGRVDISANSILDASPLLVLDEFGNPLSDEFGNALFIGDGAGGSVVIRGGTLMVDGSSILSNTWGEVNGAGPGIDLNAAEDITLTNLASITGTTFGAGRAVDISVNAGLITLTDASITSRSSSLVGGRGGDVTVTARDSITISNISTGIGRPSILSETQVSGDGGKLTLSAPSLTMENGGNILSNTFAEGLGGDILAKTDHLSLTSGAFIGSFTVNNQGGKVTVQGLGGEGTVADSVLVSGQGEIASGFYSTSFSVGRPGTMELNVRELTLTDGGVIDSGSIFFGEAGDVKVTATESVVISNGGRISSQAFVTDAGLLTITAQTLTMDNGFITASTIGIGRGGAILVDVKNLNLMHASQIVSDTSGAKSPDGDARGGNVTIIATDSVALSGESLISAKSSLPFEGAGDIGNAGEVALTALTLSLDNATITTSTTSTGNAGSITANVGTATLANGATVSSSSTESATGNAGSVTIQGLASPANSVTLTNSSLRTSAATTGRGGSITVDAASVTLDSATISASVKDFNAADPTDSAAVGTGNIALTASTITMTGGTVTAETSGTRNAGTVTMTTTGNTLNLDGGGSITSSTTSSGNAGQILITSPVLSLNNGTITTSTTGAGNAGSITANVGTATLTNGATVSSASTGAATGNAGSVTIQGLASPAQAVTLTNSQVLTSTDGSGGGGAITMDAGTINLTNATVSAASTGEGNSGNLTFTAGDTFQSDNSSVKTSAVQGQGGDIGIAAGQVQLSNATVITAESSGPGNAGNITMNILDALTLNNSTITTKAALGDGGNITLLGKEAQLFHLINSEISSSVGNPEKTTTIGGNITIDPAFVVLQNSKILANAFAGTGGNITIVAGQAVLADPSSVIDASSTLGISGTVSIEAPLTNLSSTIAPLSGSFLQAAALLQARCAAQMSGNVSSLVLAGRDAIPLEPGSLLPSPLYSGGGAPAPLADIGEKVQGVPASRSALVGVKEYVLRTRQTWKSPVSPELSCGL